jgi:hypothetical protein
LRVLWRGADIEEGVGVLRLRQSTRFASGLAALSMTVFGKVFELRLGALKAKKCGIESGDPNLRFQSRLPGSVVGEASMGQVAKADKITGVTVPW